MHPGAMYETLVDQPPGPVVRSPLAPPLRLLLRAFNILLAGASLALLLLVLLIILLPRHSLPAPGPLPEGHAASRLGLLGAQAALRSWPAWAGTGLALLGLTTAMAGLAGLDQDKRRSLSTHVAMLVALVLLHAGALILLFVATDWRGRLPEDPAGLWPAVLRYTAQHATRVKYCLIASMLAHVVAALCGSALLSIYQTAYEAWLDDNEEAATRTRKLLASRMQRMTAGGAGTPWARHLSSKYAIDSCAWEMSEDAARRLSLLALSCPRLGGEEGAV
ncbi:hypothetical protein APUTEX25_004130 [Auxenochlorella protothecoides]|uniref:Uncharacterized protein n=1 Tax=Auxenochlorella protothecoides TaxID=3075 RepID=A0A1D1ZXC6_AUXPR|nr:hypothetical protein APUTEX25_004130 [Auxenochlorella protothecoides]|eukprot:RMZ57296.1 hypothetical protein APUTEX25_004130 [Auxenochlorella protothecoides]